MAGQVRKIGNLKSLLKKHFLEATFENVIPSSLEFKVFEKFAKKNKNTAFCLIEREFPLRLIGMWHMMKNQIPSYFVHS